jgi:hypothetical protein
MRRAARHSVAGAPIPCGMVARNMTVVNRNILLARYSFERIAKSFKRGELQRRWGGKVTIGKTRSKSEVPGKRVRGMARVVQAGQGACVVGCCEGDSKPAHARPAYAARKYSARACRPPANHARNRTGATTMPGRSTESTKSAMSDFYSYWVPGLVALIFPDWF